MLQNNTDRPVQPDPVNHLDSIESVNNSRPNDEKTRNIIANMDAIDFQTLLEEQMNR